MMLKTRHEIAPSICGHGLKFKIWREQGEKMLELFARQILC